MPGCSALLHPSPITGKGQGCPFPHLHPKEEPFTRQPRELDLWLRQWDGFELWPEREGLFPGPFKSQLIFLSVYLQLNITQKHNVSAPCFFHSSERSGGLCLTLHLHLVCSILTAICMPARFTGAFPAVFSKAQKNA